MWKLLIAVVLFGIPMRGMAPTGISPSVGAVGGSEIACDRAQRSSSVASRGDGRAACSRGCGDPFVCSVRRDPRPVSPGTASGRRRCRCEMLRVVLEQLLG